MNTNNDPKQKPNSGELPPLGPIPMRMTTPSPETPLPAVKPIGTVLPRETSRTELFWAALRSDLRSRFPILITLMLCCVASYYLASRYMVCTVIIRGRSMVPTLRDGDQYLLNRIAYLFREPRRGDLVVIRDPGHTDMAIKRIIGLPGDHIEVRDGVIYLNHKKLTEPYLSPRTVTQPGNSSRGVVHLGSKSYFVMGDNRPESEDSRYYGPISRENIVGVVSL